MLVTSFFIIDSVQLTWSWLGGLFLYHDHRASVCWNNCLTVSPSFSQLQNAKWPAYSHLIIFSDVCTLETLLRKVLLYNVSAISQWMHMESHLRSDYSTTVGILHCQSSVLSKCCKLYIGREWEQGREPFYCEEKLGHEDWMLVLGDFWFGC